MPHKKNNCNIIAKSGRLSDWEQIYRTRQIKSVTKDINDKRFYLYYIFIHSSSLIQVNPPSVLGRFNRPRK